MMINLPTSNLSSYYYTNGNIWNISPSYSLYELRQPYLSDFSSHFLAACTIFMLIIIIITLIHLSVVVLADHLPVRIDDTYEVHGEDGKETHAQPVGGVDLPRGHLVAFLCILPQLLHVFSLIFCL